MECDGKSTKSKQWDQLYITDFQESVNAEGGVEALDKDTYKCSTGALYSAQVTFTSIAEYCVHCVYCIHTVWTFEQQRQTVL